MKCDYDKPKLSKLSTELDYAKNAVSSTLKSANCLVDFHGLSYWAQEVERIRAEIREIL